MLRIALQCSKKSDLRLATENRRAEKIKRRKMRIKEA
jgi:hypothetical protein